MTVNNRQSSDTSNIGHTRYRRTTIKAKEQHSKQKGKSIINNPEIQAPFWQTTHRRTTIKAKEQLSKQKGQSIKNNPEIQATMSTRRNEDKKKQKHNTEN